MENDVVTENATAFILINNVEKKKQFTLTWKIFREMDFTELFFKNGEKDSLILHYDINWTKSIRYIWLNNWNAHSYLYILMVKMSLNGFESLGAIISLLHFSYLKNVSYIEFWNCLPLYLAEVLMQFRQKIWLWYNVRLLLQYSCASKVETFIKCKLWNCMQRVLNPSFMLHKEWYIK